jgi:Chaperone of endosialidase
MSDQKLTIGNTPAAAALNGNELTWVWQGGQLKQTRFSNAGLWGFLVPDRATIATTDVMAEAFNTADGATWIKGTSTGPMAIQDAAGQWWQLDISKGYAHALWFGAVGDGSADDTSELNAASTALAAAGGGILDISGGRYLVNSADLVLRQGVTLSGPWRNVGEIASDNYSAIRSSIVLNPSYTIRLYKFAGVYGVVVLKTGMTTPTNLRQSLDLTYTFSGTAITMGDGPTQATANLASDASVGYTFIAGFDTAIYNYKNERPHIEYVQFDCTNGIRMNHITDMVHISHNHGWNFTTAHIPSIQTSYTVTGTADNGAGLVRVTIGTHIVQAGDTVVISSVTGTTEANGKWIVSAVGSTYIDLTASAYANAWVSGGVVAVDGTRRNGTAYWFENEVDFGQLDHCFCYGYARGFYIDTAIDTTLLQCSVDFWTTAADPTTIGVQYNAASNAKIIGGVFAGHGYGVYYDATAAHNSSGDYNVSINGAYFANSINNHVFVLNGRMGLVGNRFGTINPAYSATGYAIGADAASYGVIAVGNMGGTVPINISGTALERSTIVNNRWTDVSSIGERSIYDNVQRLKYSTSYGTSSTNDQVYRNARGNVAAPTATQSSDNLAKIRGFGYDGATFSESGHIRITAAATATSGATPGKITFSVTGAAASIPTDAWAVQSTGNFTPITDNAVSLGQPGLRTSTVWSANGTIQTSDAREKTDITPSVLGLDFVNALRPVSYKWKVGGNGIIRQAYIGADGEEISEGEPIPDDAMPGRIITRAKPGTRTHWGLIAQEVKETCDALNVDFGGWVLSDVADPDSQQALRYDQFVGPLIKAVQELTARIEILERKS